MKIVKLSLAVILGLTVFLIFVYPATMLLPATFSKRLPLVHLLLLALSASATSLLTFSGLWISGLEFTSPVINRSERLAMICTRLC